jgi:hypothetical protein
MGFGNQYIGVLLPDNISKIRISTRQDAYSYRWVNANFTVATPSFKSSTVIAYDPTDKLFDFWFDVNGLANVSTPTSQKSLVVNFTPRDCSSSTTCLYNNSYFLLGGCAYRDIPTGNMYYVDNQAQVLRPLGMDTFGRLGFPTLYLTSDPLEFKDIVSNITAKGLMGSNATVTGTPLDYLMLYQVP